MLGIKPAMWVEKKDPLFRLLKQYPYVDKKTISWLGKYEEIICFQNEALKQKCLNQPQVQKIERYSSEYHHFLGEILGFPSKATAWFVIKQQMDDLHQKYPHHIHYVDAYVGEQSKNVFLDYYGVTCASNYEDIEENARWLWDHYHYSPELDQLSISYDWKKVSVRRHDYQTIHKIVDQIHKLTHLDKTFSLMKYQIKQKNLLKSDNRATEFFLLDIKPILIIPNNEHLKTKYPFIDASQFPPLEKFCMYFQTEALKQETHEQFLAPNRLIKPHTAEFHRLIGTLLGYPPEAVNYFASGNYKKSLNKNVELRYCGVKCITNIDHLLEDISWLWQRYPYSEADEVSIFYADSHITDITFEDFDSLRDLQTKGKQYIEQKDQLDRLILDIHDC